MSIVLPPIMVGVYKDEHDVKKVLDKLHNESFSQEQIGILMHQGGLITPSIRNDLVKIGIPEEEANIYQCEFEAGNIIVLLRHEGRIQEAFNSLYTINITSMSVVQDKASGEEEKNTLDDMTTNSLWKLLKGAGLDHLL